MSIIVILAIVNGMNKATLDWMNERGGMRRMDVRRDWHFTNTLNLPITFTMREFDLIKELMPEVEAINATIQQMGMLSQNGNSTFARVVGTFEAYQIVNEWTVSEGRFLSHFDYRESNDVIVLGTTLQNELFGGRDAIGQLVTFQGRRLTVIGIMEHRSMPGDMWNENPLEWMNRFSFIPMSTMINKLGASDAIEGISIRALDENQPIVIKPIIEDILLNLRRGQPVFTVDSFVEQLEDAQETTRMFRIVFFFISAISLLVGGIVIMNIMLATIHERTREIGIRLAVGARQFDVFVQFLIQTVVVTFIGGVLGVLTAIAILDYVSDYLNLTAMLDVEMIIVALSVAVIVGLFFGIYPAIKASKLDPVKALRVE
jgi:putative ABC transport system permease protein